MVDSLPDVATADPARSAAEIMRADAQRLREQCDLVEAAGHRSVPVSTTALRKLAAFADRLADQSEARHR